MTGDEAGISYLRFEPLPLPVKLNPPALTIVAGSLTLGFDGDFCEPDSTWVTNEFAVATSDNEY